MQRFHVHPLSPSGCLGMPFWVDIEEGARLSANEVVRAGNANEVVRAGKHKEGVRQPLIYSVSLCVPRNMHDIALVGVCGKHGEQIAKQIWIFSELADVLVTKGDVGAVIQILMEEYEENHPLSRYFMQKCTTNGEDL